MVQNLKKVLKSKISKFFSFLMHEVPFKAKNNREAVVVCAIHVVKRPSKRSVLVSNNCKCMNYVMHQRIVSESKILLETTIERNLR